MIVEVIVDIPSHQVNHTFDYRVPESMQSAIDVGSRVKVRFGNMTRVGYIMKIKNTTDFDGELSPIVDLLDLRSYLTPELIELSQSMAQQSHAFLISILQTMLPNLLKGKYEEVFTITNMERFQETIPSWGEEIIEFRRSDVRELLTMNQLDKMIRQEIIKVEHQLVQQSTHKMAQYVYTTLGYDELEKIIASLDNRSYRQREVLQFFLNQMRQDIQTRWLQSELLTKLDVSYSTLNALITKGWLQKEEDIVLRAPLNPTHIAPSEAKTLLEEQLNAYDAVSHAMIEQDSKVFLLEGVTGSGKTEVYLQLMELALDRGESAILLVPEISLTAQMIQRVVARFQDGVAVLHSGLSAGERFDEWQRIIEGKARIVVGARSSIFAPLDNIGIIIIDEEHESTYKQSENPRYHARDVAQWRSQYHRAPLLLGSATPSLESRARAEVGKYQLLLMQHRVNQQPLPPVELIDMTQQSMQSITNEISPQLERAIHDTLNRGEQIVLLLNRRGFASYLLCRECGYVLSCPNCDISLTYHKFDRTMKCHYCNYHEPIPQRCPQCASPHIRTHGVGTQKVEESLHMLFPQARVLRMDNDTTRAKGAYQKILTQFENKEADILLGTQMIAKGLDFENVTLVGVINADTALHLPDFRAGERTFQLLAQVSGRAGRGDKLGRVIIQTYNPDHYVMEYAQRHNYNGFFYHEMHRRHQTNYPPYFYTTLITVSSRHKGKAIETINLIKQQFVDQFGGHNPELIIVGPNNDSAMKINNIYYLDLLLKYKKPQQIQSIFDQLLEYSQKMARQKIYISIDHEPQYFI